MQQLGDHQRQRIVTARSAANAHHQPYAYANK